MNEQRKQKKLWPKLVLAVSCAVLTVVFLEGAYRAKLYFTVGYTPLGVSDSYVAQDKIGVQYDREFGYSYIPNQKTIGLRVTHGQPVLMYEREFDADGNPGSHTERKVEDAEFTVFVFGDSFTAMAHRGTLWTELLEDKLAHHLGNNVRVVNYARDGYGILQMFDLAAAKVRESRSDLIIFAFINDDLNRDRFWLLVRDENSRERVFTSSVPNEDADLSKCVDMGIYNAALTKQWCQSIIESPDADDELLASLNERHAALLEDNRLPINYFSFTTSFLYNRFSYNDPFFAFQWKRPNPRFAFSDFGQDQRFVRAAAALVKTNVPVLLIHLPQYEELKSGQYVFTAQQRSLLRSLERHTGRKSIRLIPDKPLDEPVENLFRLPHDRHPSKRGMQFYSDRVFNLLIRENL